MAKRITDDKKGGVEFGKFRRNILGTLSFEFKLPNMRKMQDFSVYPATSGDTSIMIQSGTRIGRIEMSNGEGKMSQSHPNGAYGVHLSMDALVPFTLTSEQLSALKEQLAKTAGSLVGSSVVKSDNSGADKFAKGGKLTATYIPNEDIESIRTRFGQTFSGKDILDGAYVKGKVKTPKVTRHIFEEEEYEYADGGLMGSDALEAEVKTWIFRASGNIDSALRFVKYNSQVTSPFSLVYSAVRKGFIEPYQINADLLESAIETSDDIDDTYADSGEGFGSSDMNAYIERMISGAGITTKPKMGEGGVMGEVPDRIYLVTIIVTDWNNEGREHIFWGLEARTQSGNYVRYIQNADDFLNFRSSMDSKDIKLMRDYNQVADRTKANEIIEGLMMTEIPPIYTSYSNDQHYGGAEEGGWYYHTKQAIEEVTEAQYLEIENEGLDSYGEGISASEGFIFGEDEKLGREYYS
jgi:hypothetical protein